MEEYQTTNNSGFKRDQEEFQYLHQKLAHIKKLVSDFDTNGSKKLSSGGLKSGSASHHILATHS